MAGKLYIDVHCGVWEELDDLIYTETGVFIGGENKLFKLVTMSKEHSGPNIKQLYYTVDRDHPPLVEKRNQALILGSVAARMDIEAAFGPLYPLALFKSPIVVGDKVGISEEHLLSYVTKEWVKDQDGVEKHLPVGTVDLIGSNGWLTLNIKVTVFPEAAKRIDNKHYSNDNDFKHPY